MALRMSYQSSQKRLPRIRLQTLFGGKGDDATMKVFTIGYGGRSKEDFLARLNSNGVKTVVDVRLRPDRASMGIWVKAKTSDKGIESWLREAGIGYRSLIELGNVFLDAPDWQERYQQLLDSAGELLTERLKAIPGPICLLCAEKRPAECHRRQVAEYLKTRMGAEVHHLE
jgi:uncharacterized protein (DUF488 family)